MGRDPARYLADRNRRRHCLWLLWGAWVLLTLRLLLAWVLAAGPGSWLSLIRGIIVVVLGGSQMVIVLALAATAATYVSAHHWRDRLAEMTVATWSLLFGLLGFLVVAIGDLVGFWEPPSGLVEALGLLVPASLNDTIRRMWPIPPAPTDSSLT